MLASWPGSLSSLLLLSGISLVLTFLLASGVSHLRLPSLLSVLPPSQKKVLSFFDLVLYRIFFCRMMSQPFPSCEETKPPWDPRKGHLELPCVEPAPQRDRPSWSTFELKRTFLFITASFPHNKGEVERLTPELKEHHTLHILLHCNPRTVSYSSKKAFMAISREMPCNWLRNWPRHKARDELSWVIPPLGLLSLGQWEAIYV